MRVHRADGPEIYIFKDGQATDLRRQSEESEETHPVYFKASGDMPQKLSHDEPRQIPEFILTTNGQRSLHPRKQPDPEASSPLHLS